MNNFVYVVFIILISKSIVFCQNYNQFPLSHSEFDESTFEAMPEFPGGDSARIRFLNENLRYPRLALENKIEGTVSVSFTIMKTGEISNVEILSGIDNGCDEEVVRLIQSMPKWSPGIQHSNPVDVTFSMPIRFSLSERPAFEFDIESEPAIDRNEIYFISEVMPEFKGGAAQRMKFIQENIKYPVEARNKGTQGTVYVKFIVETDGSLTNLNIINGIGDGCDEEVLRVINLMPKWNPGYQGNEPVRVEMVLPVKFGIEKR